MKNDFFEIKDVDEGVDEVSFTLVNCRNKIIRITATADKLYTLLVKTHANTVIYCKKGEGLWVIWEHIKNGNYKVEEIDTSLYCLIRAANDFKWKLIPGHNGQTLLVVPLVGTKIEGASPIPKECFSHTIEYVKLGLSAMPIEKYAVDIFKSNKCGVLTPDELEKVQKCICETQGTILLFLTHLTNIQKETETWKTT